jgi:hypothetical protein
MARPLTEDLIKQKCKTDNLSLIKNMNLWGSNLTDVAMISTLPNLEVLSLSVNKLDSLKHFKSLKKLQELYLRKNNISKLDEILHLKSLPQLKVLWLSENPVVNVPGYRAFVVKHLPHLTKLDDKNVTPEERDDTADEGVQRSEEEVEDEVSSEEPIAQPVRQSNQRNRRQDSDEEVEIPPPPKTDRGMNRRGDVVSGRQEKSGGMLREPEPKSLRPKNQTFESEEIPAYQNRSFHDSARGRPYQEEPRKKSVSPPKPSGPTNRFRKDAPKEPVREPTREALPSRPILDKNKSSKVKHETVLGAILMLVTELNEFELDLLQEECRKRLEALSED